MRHVRSILGAAAVAALLTGGAGMARAESDDARATGSVLVFEHELASTTRFDDPTGCVKLPPTAHLLTNLTDADIRVYADPFCLTPSLVVPPGTGAHLAPLSASFSA
ncbi:hypothetical protein [Actinophytocola sediminis]